MNYDKYFVIGKPSAKSASPIIYNYLFNKYNINSYYSRLTLQDVKYFKRIMEILDIKGCNITMPYKQSFFHLSENFDDYSKITESINTITILDKIRGYNTDYIGFEHTLQQYNCNVSRRRVLLIGAGNTAGSVLRVLDGYELQIDILNRNPMNVDILKSHFNNLNAISLENICDLQSNYDVIINTIPNLYLFKDALSGVTSEVLIDFDYISNELKDLVNIYDVLIDGYHLLINQALYAFDIFFNKRYSLVASDNSQIHQELYDLLISNTCRFNNIIFNGFMGTGKSTLGIELASKFNMNFIDIDVEIEKSENMTVEGIFAQKGEDYFRNCEKTFLDKLVNVENSIIATGGGLLQNVENINLCKKIGYNVYLLSDFEDIIKRIKNTNRPIYNTLNYNELEALYKNRINSYYLASDLVFFNTRKFDSSFEHLATEFQPIILKRNNNI